MRAANGNELELLAERASTGNVAAFEELVSHTHGIAYRLAFRMLGDKSDAEDVLQDVYIRAWAGLPKLRNHAAVLAWLCRMVRNVATDKVRYQSRRRADSLHRPVGGGMGELMDFIATGGPGPDEQMASKQMSAALVQVVGELKEKHRVVLLLREVDGLSYEELASALGCPVGTVESRLHRARRELAGKLRRYSRSQLKESA